MHELEKRNAALSAVAHIKPGHIVGLGTGSTAYFAIQEIGALVTSGLTIQAIPTSKATHQLATQLNIPLVDINRVDAIDITIDGADEFTKELFLIKGGGGALLREKIVASLTKQEIIIADASKLVKQLGAFKVPIEVIPFATNLVLQQLAAIHGKGFVRTTDQGPFLTDQGNIIIDADFGLIADPAELAQQLDHITGIVEHGLFIQKTHKIIMGSGMGIEVYS